MKIAFVSDSTTDIPAELAARHGIEVVPSIVNIRERSYLDGIELSREEFYTMLPAINPPPTTSAPSVGNFEERYEKLLQAGAEHIFSIHTAAALSGIYNAARLAANAFDGRVTVFDTEQLSLGAGLQVLAAVETAQQGGSIEQVGAAVESARKRARVACLLSSMEYIRRSGRVSWTKAMLGSLLNLQPLIELRFGRVIRLGQVRIRKQGVHRLLEVLNSWGPTERLAVLHTNAEQSARQLFEQVKNKAATVPLLVNVTTAIGTHVGPNGLGFAAIPYE